MSATVIVCDRAHRVFLEVPVRKAVAILFSQRGDPVLHGNAVKEYKVNTDLIPEYLEACKGDGVFKVPPTIQMRGDAPVFGAVSERPSRPQVFARDKNQCQYCGKTNNLTLDHLVPLCRGGKYTWENLVTACTDCNNRKGAYLLEEVGMHLRSKPGRPKVPAAKQKALNLWLGLQD